MGKLIVLILITIVFGILWALPLYLCGNLVLWCFNIPFHLTLLQAFAVTLLGSVIHSILFKNKEG